MVVPNEEMAKSVSGKIEWLASFGSLLRLDAISLGIFPEQQESAVTTSSQKRVPEGEKIRKRTINNEYKEFEGKQYYGMKVGRSHKWYYDRGEWKEKKITPDKWEFTFHVNKRRSGKAPEGFKLLKSSYRFRLMLMHPTMIMV